MGLYLSVAHTSKKVPAQHRLQLKYIQNIKLYSMMMDVHCGRCQMPIWKDEADDVNTRPQSASGNDDDFEMWCSECSVTHSGNLGR